MTLTTHKSKVTNIVLSIFAILFILVVFVIDLFSPIQIAVGNFYVLIILYSYLLNFKNANLYLALICSVLLFIANAEEIAKGQQNELSNLNLILVLVPIWVCSALVGIAKRGLEELDSTLQNKSSILELKTNQLQKLNKELEQRVFERTTELNAKNKSLEEFAYAASHDLQEPLNTINNFSELLSKKLDELPDKKITQYLGFLASSSKRLRSLIQDLLEHTQIDYRLSFESIELNEMLESIIQDLDQLINKNQVMIQIEKLPPIKGDYSYLRLLFQNLINNAIKFSHKGILNEIKIKAKETESSIIFSISDKGIGIPDNKKEEIFTVFKRLHQNDKYSGNGIGLANCKKIVDYHGGKIWVESKLNQGSTFFVKLNK